ncbi:hypothetical protein I3W98_22965, partial [Streptomyces cavourensis]|nr:hypothetical protein [Streptomyces cavourensis]
AGLGGSETDPPDGTSVAGCIAVPYVPATASDPAFTAADLLFAQGQSAFTAEAAYGWLLGGAEGAGRSAGPGARP